LLLPLSAQQGASGHGAGRRRRSTSSGGSQAGAKRVRLTHPTHSNPYIHVDYLTNLLRIEANHSTPTASLRTMAVAVFIGDPTPVGVQGLVSTAREAAMALRDGAGDMEDIDRELERCAQAFGLLLQGKPRQAAAVFATSAADGGAGTSTQRTCSHITLSSQLQVEVQEQDSEDSSAGGGSGSEEESGDEEGSDGGGDEGCGDDDGRGGDEGSE